MTDKPINDVRKRLHLLEKRVDRMELDGVKTLIALKAILGMLKKTGFEQFSTLDINEAANDLKHLKKG